MFKKTLLAAMFGCTGLMMVGCSDDNKEDKNDIPIIKLPETVSVLEKQSLVIEAEVIDDGHVNYQWQQLSGINVELHNDTAMQLAITAPSVMNDELIELELTATDSEGEVAKAIVQVEINQIWLEGQVTGQIKEVHGQAFNIEAKLGEHVFASKSNAQGEFTLNLKFDDDIIFEPEGALFNVTAQALNSPIGYTAYIVEENINELLRGEAISNWQLSSATTAKAELLSRAALYKEILSAKDLQQLSFSIFSYVTVNNTTAYEYLIENTATGNAENGLALPQGYDSTTDFIFDTHAFQSYVDSLNPDYNSEFQNKKKSLITSELFKRNTERVKRIVFNSDAFSGDTFTDLQFNQDGTGQLFFNKRDNIEFTWQQVGNKFTLNKEGGFLVSEKDEEVDFNGETITTRVVSHYPQLDVYLVEHSPVNAVVYTETTLIKSYPDIEKEAFQTNVTNMTNAFTNWHFNEFDDITFGATYSFPFKDSTSLQFVFEDSSNGLILDYFEKGRSIPFTWNMLRHESGHQYIEIETEFFTHSIEALGNNLLNNHFLASYSENGSLSSKIDLGGMLNIKEITFEEVAGIYSREGYSGIQEAEGGALNAQWYELLENGKGYWVTVNDNNNNNVIENDEVILLGGDWSVAENIIQLDANCIVAECSREFDFYWSFSNPALTKQYMHYIYKINYLENDATLLGQWYTNYDRAEGRPINTALPEWVYEYLPRNVGQSEIVGLLPIKPYLDKPLYHADHDYWYDQATGFLQLNSDATYTRLSRGETVTEQYQVDEANQVLLTQPNTTSGYYNYGFLAESDNVVLGAFIGLPWPHFYDEQSAKDYAKRVFDMTHTKSFSDYYGQAIFMADRDQNGEWQVAPLKFSENQVTIYKDAAMTEVANVMNKGTDYTLEDDGRILFSDGNSLYIPLATSGFASVVTDDVENASKDFNYFFFDFEQAETFVKAVNDLRRSID